MSDQHHRSKGKEQLQELFDRLRRGEITLSYAGSDLFGRDKKNVIASAGIDAPVESNGEHELVLINVDSLGKQYSGKQYRLIRPNLNSNGALGYKHIDYLQGEQTHMAMIADDDTLVLGTYNGETPTALYLGSWPLSEDVPLNASGEGKWTDVKRK